MVTRVAVGAPDEALPVPVAPIAPAPAPVVSTFLKLMTVIDETTVWDNVAVTVTLLRGLSAKARQISDVPLCAFVLLTRTQVKPAPATPVTVVAALDTLSPSIKANNNSFPEVVEKVAVATVRLAVA